MRWWQTALVIYAVLQIVVGVFLWFVGRNAQRREAEAHELFERDYERIVEDERRKRAAGGRGEWFDEWFDEDGWGDDQ